MKPALMTFAASVLAGVLVLYISRRADAGDVPFLKPVA